MKYQEVAQLTCLQTSSRCLLSPLIKRDSTPFLQVLPNYTYGGRSSRAEELVLRSNASSPDFTKYSFKAEIIELSWNTWKLRKRG